jgi:GNAT superfamily N-acetyltransferase
MVQGVVDMTRKFNNRTIASRKTDNSKAGEKRSGGAEAGARANREYPELMRLVEISPCQPEDYAALRELHTISINTNGWRFYSLAEVAERLKEIETPDYAMALARENVLIARIGETMVATASWRPSQRLPQTAIITQIFLHPFFTRGGIATRLIDEIEKEAYEQGFRFVSAHSDLNSRKLFSKLGYEPQGFEFGGKGDEHQYPYQVMTRKIAANGALAPHPGQAASAG